ncbi:hypothetical protein B0H13DRAFT_1899605 [Mycena leptocephala]|nr:hypothetical protein B0H13DRAFT_1899605 [Mycena leptocephala]
MFGGVDELERWDDDSQLREDEGQGFTNIAMALSACLDWNTSAQTFVDRANAEVLADPAKRNGPFTDGSMLQYLIYYSRLIDPTAILFSHRDEYIHGREHWLLFRLDGKKRECIDPLEDHQKIYNSTQITADTDVVAAYLLGETLSLHFSFESIQGVKQHLKQIWTLWQIGEGGLEEAALNALLKHFNAEVVGPLGSCIASRPQWITRAEEVVLATLDSSESLLNPETQSGKNALPREVEDSVSSDGETMSHEQALTAMKISSSSGPTLAEICRAVPEQSRHYTAIRAPIRWSCGINCTATLTGVEERAVHKLGDGAIRICVGEKLKMRGCMETPADTVPANTWSKTYVLWALE